MLVEWPPWLGLYCRQRRQVEQPAQFGRSAFGEAPFAAMLSRVIRSRVQAGEGDKSIRALQGHTLEGVDQSVPTTGPTPVIVHKRVKFCLRSGLASTNALTRR